VFDLCNIVNEEEMRSAEVAALRRRYLDASSAP
jgi:hypothetical protein